MDFNPQRPVVAGHIRCDSTNNSLYRAGYQLDWLDELFHEVCDEGLAEGCAAGGCAGMLGGGDGISGGANELSACGLAAVA